MADIVYNNVNKTPEMQVKITFSSKRNKDKVTITATVYERFIGGNTPPYDFPGGSSLGWCTSDTGLYGGWKLTFKMTSGNVSNSVVMKDNSNWMWSSEPSRTKKCSITITTTKNTAPITCQITSNNSSYQGGTMPSQSKTISIDPFVAPTAPTWISVSPNPCNVNSNPTITWGGASAGSMGVVRYDLAIRSTKPNGSWTDWTNLLSSTTSTSYANPVINSMNVAGQTPFYGVKYQYRVRSWDGSYSNSAWAVSRELQVGFISPTPPTSFTWGSASVKKDGSFSVRWSGASGGSGSISKYRLQFLYYTKATGGWTNVGIVYTGSVASYSGTLSTLFPNAKNGDRITVRVSTNNSWDMWSSTADANSIPVRANQIWIKINGTWVEGDCYIKNNGTWVEGMPYIKVNGTWKEST